MLDQNLKSQVTSLFASLKHQYTFQAVLPAGDSSSDELKNLLEEVASCSPNISTTFIGGAKLEFRILKDGVVSSFSFRAVPNGHEFTTLLLAVLNMEGIGKNLPDDSISNKIKSLKGKVEVKSYISLSCTNCPDVVQALNVMSIINPNIEHHIIDGGINKAEVEALNIQAVPTVYVNGEQFHVGRSSMGELISKLEAEIGMDESAEEQPVKERNYDVVVVGGGPAGVSSAIYTARKGLSVALIADSIGGQVKETVDIENMISINKTTGKELSANLNSHLADYDIDIFENRRVENVDLVDGKKKVLTSLNEEFITSSLIIATGASWRKLNVPGETEYIGNGVAFCTHCDGPFYKGKKVAVIGGGNSGLEAAIDLAGIASEVTVLEFADSLKGDQVLQDKLNSMANVNIVTNAATTEVVGNGSKVTALRYNDREENTTHELPLDGVFVQIGLLPNSGSFRSLVETNPMGEIKIDAACRTSVPGVYAAGDVSEVPYKQIVIAMGEGSKAALSAFEDHIKGLNVAVLEEAYA
ncbi:alkyl hydroperoxide reductase subunit F [Aureibacter tunicatorum]|uniref:Alkyl hydroperoxide reductase subunit F n=1 Tax=Aureibacter tunicatorum TaxID=866807 RepID=A0AAE3XKF6_9BACT|nr:alkyl hydroperoxide reductase subunit F [Aureibacter tunicatorum]MDR6237570.1 alkyl hydroperoxide reductase subunit F [Aureibacter tunicatorum]BDD02604.1 alkyl hydroperoxide reductase subunit F [Aureibacter tunicatorum]